MNPTLLRAGLKLRRFGKSVSNAVVGHVTVGLLRLLRHVEFERLARFTSGVTRTFGPWMREQRTGRANLVAAFPEKSPTEIEQILTNIWDGLGRLGAEFAHMDHIWDYDPARPNAGRIELPPQTVALFARLREDGKGALIFASHLGNWELPAIAAAAHGLDSAVLFRRPNVAAVDRAIQDIRGVNMGEMIANTNDAPRRLAEAVQAGKHVGMLIDQWFGRGVEVTFFGRKTMANPILARIARHVDCPIHGVRVIRLPDNRFRIELSEEVMPVRDASGAIDAQATTQKITGIIEGWIREYPDQWLWLHRRWRPLDRQ
jgi:KDO2-lipid IV(A) lauroyltransferase